jgi:hypothetical protein
VSAELGIGLVGRGFAAHFRARAAGRIGQGTEGAAGGTANAGAAAEAIWLLQQSLLCASDSANQIAAGVQKVAEGVKDHAHIS